MSTQNDLEYFYQLRKMVSNEFLSRHSAQSTSSTEWSGQEIMDFQEDLLERVNARVSEKWFYTYFKQNKIKKLPRIDMLNLLSEYVGNQNWADFKQKNSTEHQETKAYKPKSNLWIYMGAIALFLVLIYFASSIVTTRPFIQFCFVDADRNQPILSPINIEILIENESPVYLQSNDEGCFSYQPTRQDIRFVIQSPFHKSDTLVRSFTKKNYFETVALHTDEYSLMLYYLNQSKVEDWQKRRNEWNELIDDDALIYRVWDETELGIDVMDKQEFINYMTLPTKSLKQFHLIEKNESGGKINFIKFKINSDE